MITLHQVYRPTGGLRFFHFFSLFKKQRDFLRRSLEERGVWWNVGSLPFSVADSVWQRYFMKMSGLCANGGFRFGLAHMGPTVKECYMLPNDISSSNFTQTSNIQSTIRFFHM